MKKLIRNWQNYYENNKEQTVQFFIGMEAIFGFLFILKYINPFLEMAGDIGGMVPYLGSLVLLIAEKKYGIIPWDFLNSLSIYWHALMLALLLGVIAIAQYTLKPLIILLKQND